MSRLSEMLQKEQKNFRTNTFTRGGFGMQPCFVYLSNSHQGLEKARWEEGKELIN